MPISGWTEISRAHDSGDAIFNRCRDGVPSGPSCPARRSQNLRRLSRGKPHRTGGMRALRVPRHRRIASITPDVDASKLDPATLLREALRARGAQAEIITRARFTEDRLLSALQDGVSQYVILGAGLDTFALRRADLRDRLTVFEIDLPTSQDSKRARLAAAGLAYPLNLQFLAADFERERVADVLLRSAYRRDRRGFFSWLGVTFYLSSEAVSEVLR